MDNDQPIRVLYVNDDKQSLQLVENQLTRENNRFTITTATSAERGRLCLDQTAIDCILCDYHMPGLTGVEFLQQVREDYPDLPFLLFTETGNEKVASNAIEAGVSDYIIQEAIGNQAPLLAQKIVTHVEHRRSQQQIEQTNERLREIVSVTEQVLWVFSPDWSELRFINDAHESLFGQSVETLHTDPTSFLEQVHDQDIDRVKLAMERASDGNPQVVEYRVNKSDSVQIWVESRCKPVTDDTGTLTSLVGLSRDITDRKAHQRESIEKIDQLEEFTSTVAHDLRNPLNIADGNIRLAAAEHESEYLDAALDSIERMDSLIEELLTLAQKGKLLGEQQHIEFAELITTAHDNVRAPGCSLNVEGSVLLECDPVRVTEAFENLVRNAVEHGSSDVTLTAGILAGEGGVYIEDDGPGILEEGKEMIFEKGYTTRKDGSGFGLSIVERIVSAHGWGIGVEDGESGGARFVIRTE